MENNLIAGQKFWSLIDNKNFSNVITWLAEKGVPEDKMGEILFDFSHQAINTKMFARARSILIFLIEALEDSSEEPQLLKLIGDVCLMENDYEKAREYYGRLPLTIDNIKLCFQTFLPKNEIDKLFLLRDKILARAMEKHHSQIHMIIGEIMAQVIGKTEIFKAHQNLYAQNVNCLKTIFPFNKKDFFFVDFQSHQPDVVKINHTIFIKRDDVWQKLISNNNNRLSVKKMDTDQNIIVYCSSAKTLLSFIESIQTDTPEFIKYECRVIIDFKLLLNLLSVVDLSSLRNCDYVISFIDSNHITSQLKHILLEKKLPFTNKVVYLGENDPTFFSQHVIPVLKECEKEMLDTIALYEQQIIKLFPEEYYNTVIKKIKEDRKLRIIFFTSRFTSYMQYSSRDIADGFNQLGHETFIELEAEDSGVSIRKDVCLKNLIDYKPDIIFAINHFRYSYPWIPKSIPFVTWIQDILPHMHQAKDPGLITAFDHLFYYGKPRPNDFFGNHIVFKAKKRTFLPIPINKNIYHPLPNIKKKYDVIFISHISANYDKTTLFSFGKGVKTSGLYSPEEIKFLTHVAKEIDQTSFKNLPYMIWSQYNPIHVTKAKKFAAEICQKLSMEYSNDLVEHLMKTDKNGVMTRFFNELRMKLKTKPVKHLLNNGINIKVFGNHWDKLEGFKAAAMGPIKNGPPLNQVLNQSKIVLNINPGVSWHMRTADAIASGSFTLTFLTEIDSSPITDLLKNGKEMIGFEDEKDLLAKVKYYLENKKAREKIARNANKKASKKFANKSHARTILETISNASG